MTRPRPSTSSRLWRTFLLITLGFALGVVVATVGESRAELRPSPYSRLNTFAKVMSYIERSYVEPVAQSELIDAAIKGMVAHLDAHSAYLTADEYKAFREETDGEFVGVGLEIGMRDGYIKVVAPLDGAPAARAGVLAGDIVVAIDGKSTRGWTLRETVRRLKGKSGTVVSIEVLRLPDGQASSFVDLTRAVRKEFELERETIDVVSVSGRLMDKGIAYLRIRSFQQEVAAELEEQIDELEAKNGAPLAGVVLDLRNNPGGLLAEAVQVVDLFVTKGVIVTTESRGKVRVETFEARPTATRTKAPLVVLVNHGSASASEIVAGAIQDHGRGTVLGTASFGKGSVQSIIDMKDGSGLKLTTARYFTPDHRSIQDLGIRPDIEVPQLEAGAKSGTGEDPAGPDGKKTKHWFHDDYQLRSAHEHLLTTLKMRSKDKDTAK